MDLRRGGIRWDRLFPTSRSAIAIVVTMAACAAGCSPSGGEWKSGGADSVPPLYERPSPPDGSRNVLLITVDTLRADHLGCYGYGRDTSPVIDRLAEEGVRFDRAQAPRSLTWPTLSSILTSMYPRTHGVRRNGDRLDASLETLPRLLRRNGWIAGAFAASMKTAPDPGVDVRFAAEGDAPWPEQDRQITEAAIGWIEENASKRFFAWLHYIGPHDPYSPDPPYDTMFADDYEGPWDGSRESLTKITSERVDLGPDDLAHIIALYDGEIRATDDLIRRVLETLDRLGLADSTLVVLTSDHGEELYERNHYFQHGCSVYDSVLHVPLILRLPGALPAGLVFEQTVELLDVMPTVLGLVGIEPNAAPEKSEPTDGPAASADMEGIDLTPLLTAHAGSGGLDALLRSGASTFPPNDRLVDGSRYAVAEYRDRILSLRTDEWRYVWNPDVYHPASSVFRQSETGHPGYVIGREELYHTAEDPAERTNVVAEHPQIAARFRDALQAWASRRPNVMSPGKFDEETQDELRALGYID